MSISMNYYIQYDVVLEQLLSLIEAFRLCALCIQCVRDFLKDSVRSSGTREQEDITVCILKTRGNHSVHFAHSEPTPMSVDVILFFSSIFDIQEEILHSNKNTNRLHMKYT